MNTPHEPDEPISKVENERDLDDIDPMTYALPTRMPCYLILSRRELAEILKVLEANHDGDKMSMADTVGLHAELITDRFHAVDSRYQLTNLKPIKR